ncbi:NosD domain-containing protein [Halobacteriaceae archaeon GCM10025711]
MKALPAVTATVLLALSVVAGGIPAFAASGSTAAGTAVDSCTVIDEPGRYELASNLTSDQDSGGEACLVVASSDVTLDGNGHTIDATDDDQTGGVVVVGRAETLTNVTVTDLRVTGQTTGVSLRNVADSRVADVTATHNANGVWVRDSENVTVADSVVSRNDGRSADGSGFGVRISGDFEHPTASDGTVVENTTVVENPYRGVAIEGSADNVVRDSHIAGNGDWLDDPDQAGGVRITNAPGNELAGNVIEANDVHVAAQVTENAGTVVRGNEFRQATVRVGNDDAQTTATGTAVTGNAFAGGGVELRSPARDTTVAGNAFRDGGTVRVTDANRTTVRNNTVVDAPVAIAVRSATGATVDGNAVRNATDVGIEVTNVANASVTGNLVAESQVGVAVHSWRSNLDGYRRVTGNLVVNGTTGIDVGSPLAPVTVRANEVRANEYGVVVDEPGQCVAGPEGAELVAIHGNDFVGNGLGVDNRDPETVNATGNYWGSSDGPSSTDDEDAPFADPETGEPADGSGDAVSEGVTAGVSNVHFDAWASNETVIVDA